MPRWNALTERYLGRISERLKRKRVELFVRELSLGPHDSVLDLGSEDGSYLAKYYPYPQNIVLGDVREGPMQRGVDAFGLKGYVVLPENGAIPVGDREFDAVWCNSVIEHVTVSRDELASTGESDFRVKAEAHQREFARELRRVAKQYLVQTPNIHFLVEAHSWLPGVQYLRQERRVWLSSALKKIWLKQWTADWYLYDLERFRRHFPDATRFHVERAFGFAKSFIAIRKGETLPQPSRAPS